MVLYVTYREMITKTVIDKIYINKYPTEGYEHMKRFCLDDDYITTDSGLFIKNIDIICDKRTHAPQAHGFNHELGAANK